MAEAQKFTRRRRYFTQWGKHADALPADRLLYLELTEIDEDAGVARFEFELNVPEGELWRATVEGFESRSEVRSAVKEAVVAAWIDGSTLTIPLSRKPQVAQIEVRSADLTSVTVYRVTTWGRTERDFRYRLEEDPAEASDAERLVWRIEGGELVGYDLGEGAVANGEWALTGDELVFDDAGPVASPGRSALNGADELMIYTPEG